MQQALFKYEMPGLEMKSSRSFLAIKRCQQTKIQKVIKLARSSNFKSHICDHRGYSYSRRYISFRKTDWIQSEGGGSKGPIGCIIISLDNTHIYHPFSFFKPFPSSPFFYPFPPRGCPLGVLYSTFTSDLHTIILCISTQCCPTQHAHQNDSKLNPCIRDSNDELT